MKGDFDFMSEWYGLNDASKDRWETNAAFWDDYMGDHSNSFHREVIRPQTEELMKVQPGHHVLDIGCGNGNFSRRLAEFGAHVTAIDYSSTMIERAKSRTKDLTNITYNVTDATDHDAILALGKERFDRAVSNMAFMDISDITPLVKALYQVLKPDGTVVFSISHPCFQTPNMKKIQETEELDGEIITRYSIQTFDYLNPRPYQSIGIRGQTVPHYMFHRPLEYYFSLFFTTGFVLDGFMEPSFSKEKDEGKFDWYDIPPVSIFRFKKGGQQ